MSDVSTPITSSQTIKDVYLPMSFISILEHGVKESKFRSAFGFAGFLLLFPKNETSKFLDLDAKILTLASLGLLVCAVTYFYKYLRYSKLVHDAHLYEALHKISPTADFDLIETLIDKKSSTSKKFVEYSGGGRDLKVMDSTGILAILFSSLFLALAAFLKVFPELVTQLI